MVTFRVLIIVLYFSVNDLYKYPAFTFNSDDRVYLRRT